jgi:hypothetical protein
MAMTMSNILVGRADVSNAQLTHVKGVHEGNEPGGAKRERRVEMEGDAVRATARRSTSINPDRREPIDPRMPNLSPA